MRVSLNCLTSPKFFIEFNDEQSINMALIFFHVFFFFFFVKRAYQNLSQFFLKAGYSRQSKILISLATTAWFHLARKSVCIMILKIKELLFIYR